MSTKTAPLSYQTEIEAIDPRTPRIERLINRYLDEPIYICSHRTRLATESWRETEGEPLHLRRAKLFEKICLEMPISIFEDELIVGSQTPHFRGVGLQLDYNPITGLELKQGDLRMRAEQSLGKIEDEDYEQIIKDTEYWLGRSPGEAMLKAIHGTYGSSYEDATYCCTRSYAKFTNYAAQADYEKVLKIGFRGIIAEIDEELSKIDFTTLGDGQRHSFLKAARISCLAFIALANRYGDLAAELAEKEEDAQRKAELETIAKICRRVPEHPAETYWEALQSIRFVHLGLYLEDANGAGASLCRMDQYLFPIYEKEIEAASLNRKEAMELLASFWVKIVATDRLPPGSVKTMGAGYVQSRAILGGLKRDGSDGCNEQTYMILHVGGKMKLDFPLFLRWHPDMNREFMRKGLWTNIEMGSEPAFHNDEQTIRGLVEDGASLQDARDYTLQGCTHPYPFGTVYGTPIFVNGAKVMELVMYNGYDPKIGKQVGPKTGDPRTFTSAQDWIEAFKPQWKRLYDILNHSCNIGESVQMQVFSQPFASALTADCIKNGMGVHEGGCRYNRFIGDVMNKPYADLPDSIAAIEHLAYNKKEYTVDEIIAACSSNFEGEKGAEIRQKLLSAPKFGNNLGRPEEIYREISDYIAQNSNGAKNYFGEYKRDVRAGGAIHTAQGLDVGALPNGRYAGKPLADGGISPCAGFDMMGPTATMASVGIVANNFKSVRSAVLNQKIPKTMLSTEEERERFIDLVEAYFEGYGGYQVQWNIHDNGVYKQAQTDPDSHKNLIVRVGGFSAYYVELDRALQQQIIDRTEQKV